MCTVQHSYVSLYNGLYMLQCGRWHSVHIDDLRQMKARMPSLSDMRGKSVGTLVGRAVSRDVGEDLPPQPGAATMDWEDSDVAGSGNHDNPQREPPPPAGPEEASVMQPLEDLITVPTSPPGGSQSHPGGPHTLS
jgi:hypothetical protein